MNAYLFTFGQGHVHPKTGEPLDNRFVRIEAANEVAARLEMVRRFARKWCGCYWSDAGATADERAGVERFRLTPLDGDLALGLLGAGPIKSALGRMPAGPARRGLEELAKFCPADAEELAADYLAADEDVRAEIDARFAIAGLRYVREQGLKHRDGTPTSADLREWAGDL